MDYRQFIARHYESDADVTVSVTPCDETAASDFGLLKTDESGRIVEFKEKPKGDDLQTMRVDTSKLGLNESEALRRTFSRQWALWSSSMIDYNNCSATIPLERFRTRDNSECD